MDKKKILIIGSIVAVILLLAVIIYIVSKPKEETLPIIEGMNLPTNKDILKDTTIGNLEIKNISLIIRNGKSTFQATISNKTEEDIKINKLYAIFYEGETQNKKTLVLNSTIPSNKDALINILSESDLTNTTKIEYVIE